MKKHTERQIAAIVLDTLTRSMTIAKEQGATISTLQSNREAITLDVLAEIHKSAANNLGQVLTEALFEEVTL